MKLNHQTQNYLSKHVTGYVSKDSPSPNDKKYLRLDLGENLLGCSPHTLKALHSLTPKDLNLYPDPSGNSIKTVIADLYGLKKENITLANSSNEIIDYLPRMVLHPTDRALVISPTFFRFVESTFAAGGGVKQVQLKEKNGHFTNAVIDSIINKIRDENIQLVWLANPNNPTGTALTLNQIKYIVEHTHNLVVLDEAFYEYFDLTNSQSGIQLVNKYPHLIVLRTLSKAYGLAGLRFAYAISHPKTVDTIERYRQTLLMTSRVIQKIATVALQDQEWLAQTVNETSQLRHKLFSQIRQLKNLIFWGDSATNIYLIRHKTKDLYQELKHHGVLAADFRQALGLKGKGWVRLTIGNQAQNQKLYSILQKI